MHNARHDSIAAINTFLLPVSLGVKSWIGQAVVLANFYMSAFDAEFSQTSNYGTTEV